MRGRQELLEYCLPGRVPEPARSLALSGPEVEVGVCGWGDGGGRAGLPNFSPKADCVHALGALCRFGRGFHGGTWEQDRSLVGPPKSLLGWPSAPLGLGRKSVSVCECPSYGGGGEGEWIKET